MGEQQETAVRALHTLAPGGIFKEFRTIDAEHIRIRLETRPLTLLHFEGERDGMPHTYIMRPGQANQDKFPGLVSASRIPAYAKLCATQIAEALRPRGCIQMILSKICC